MSNDRSIDLREHNQRESDIYDAYFRGQVTLNEALDNLPIFFAVFIPLLEGRLPQLEQQMIRNAGDNEFFWSINGGEPQDDTYYGRVERNIREAYLSQNLEAIRFFVDQLPPSFGPPLPSDMNPDYGLSMPNLRDSPFPEDYGHYGYSFGADTDSSNAGPISIQFEDSDADDIDIPEDERCNLCDCRITVHFGECSHAVCNSCSIKLWLARLKDDRSLPTWFKCPWCRVEVTKLGILLHEQHLQSWSGDKVKHGETLFCVGAWYSLQEWMTLNGYGGFLSLL